MSDFDRKERLYDCVIAIVALGKVWYIIVKISVVSELVSLSHIWPWRCLTNESISQVRAIDSIVH